MVIVDTGFWLALLDRNDSYHLACVRVLKGLNEPLISTTAVLTETSHLILARLGSSPIIRFIESISDGLTQLFEVKHEHLPRVAKLMQKYRNLPMDFADASLVILAEQLGHGRILSTDQRDFKTYRWKERQPFKNLLADTISHK